jgi:hypothetical protein
MDQYRRGVPYNSAKLFDVEYTTVGTLAAPHRQLRAEEHGAVRSSVRLAERDDVLVGANLLGRRWDHAVVRGWIAERRPLAWVRENLSDASFDTEMVPPLDPAALRWEEG